MKSVEIQIDGSEILKFAIIWTLIVAFTFGVGLIVLPYYSLDLVLKRARLRTLNGETYRFKVNGDLFSYTAHAILWVLIILMTIFISTLLTIITGGALGPILIPMSFALILLWPYNIYTHVLSYCELVKEE